MEDLLVNFSIGVVCENLYRIKQSAARTKNVPKVQKAKNFLNLGGTAGKLCSSLKNQGRAFDFYVKRKENHYGRTNNQAKAGT